MREKQKETIKTNAGKTERNDKDKCEKIEKTPK
jgi:hypothetical protein